MTSTLTSREFNRNPSAAKRAAEKEPVIITDRGQPRFVLVEYEAFAALEAAKRPKRTLYDALAHPESADIDFDPPKLTLKLKPVDFDLD
jgi:prevent-host-death family protein